jgi:transposase
MLYLSASTQYFFYLQKVDMRKGCYGLCGIVQNEMKKNIMSGAVFVFLNKRHNQIKLLQWDKDGFALYEKKLEKGTFEQPVKQADKQAENTDILLSNVQLQLILQGIILQSVRHKIRYSR